ncbi:MAG: 3-hydroxyacyl-CoA dehydrogenase family protein [Firmicutes bacterium]|nr:3-hydroxyacyl-CoA dehydrogenase family protein [Bacillota bacterium]
MTDMLLVIGNRPEEVAAWTTIWPDPVTQASVAMVDPKRPPRWVVEATVGPLSLKRQHLRRLAARGVTHVLSASISVTVGAQKRWVDGGLEIVGYDPVIAMGHGRTWTLSGDSAAREALPAFRDDRTPIPVADAVGMVAARIWLPIINEAAAYVAQGLDPETVDRAVRLGLNYPVGPMEFGERLGWHTVYWGLRALEDMEGPRFRPHPWIRAQIGSSLLDREDSD